MSYIIYPVWRKLSVLELVKILFEYFLQNAGIRAWLLMNLHEDPTTGKIGWRVNLVRQNAYRNHIWNKSEQQCDTFLTPSYKVLGSTIGQFGYFRGPWGPFYNFEGQTRLKRLRTTGIGFTRQSMNSCIVLGYCKPFPIFGTISDEIKIFEIALKFGLWLFSGCNPRRFWKGHHQFSDWKIRIESFLWRTFAFHRRCRFRIPSGSPTSGHSRTFPTSRVCLHCRCRTLGSRSKAGRICRNFSQIFETRVKMFKIL